MFDRTIKPKTPDVFAPLWETPARYKGAWGGRGSGKSHDRATHIVVRMLEGARVVCLREVQNSIKDSVKQLIEDKIAALGVEDQFEIVEQEIRGPNGSICLFKGLQNHTAQSIKSLEGMQVAWVEEAQTISAKSLQLLTPTIRAPGSELWFTWNPSDESDPVEHLLRHDPPEDSVVIEAHWKDNPWFPDGLRTDMERDRRRDPAVFQHVWNGAYSSRSETRIFRNWRVDEFHPPDDVRWFYGIDWGFANDPTAALRCCVVGDVMYVDHEASEVGCPIERTPELLCKVPDIKRWPSRADSARPETIDYCRRNGLPQMRPADKGKGSVEDGIEFIRGFDLVVHPRCVRLERELTMYSYKTDKQTGEILPKVEDEHNHLIDALRYAVEGLHRKGKRLPRKEERPVYRRDYGRGQQHDDSLNYKVL